MFDSAGTALAPQQNMSVNAGLSQNAPSIAATAGGGFVAVWSCAHNASVFPENLQDAVGVFGQRFNASGIGQGEFQVLPNLTRSMVNEINPSVTVLPDGKIVMIYESNVGSANFPTYARVFNADNAPFTDEFFNASGATQPTITAVTGGFGISWCDIDPVPATINSIRYAYDAVVRSATLEGGVGNDVLTDGAGDAILLRGAGNDTLTGGTEADRFVISATSAFGNDTIADYSAAQGDVLMATTPFVFSNTLNEIRSGTTTIARAEGALMYTTSHGSVRINDAG